MTWMPFAVTCERGEEKRAENGTSPPCLARERRHDYQEGTAMLTCHGTRDGHHCGSPLYRCENCGNLGCRAKKHGMCTKQAFSGKGKGKCLSCGKCGTADARIVVPDK